MNTIFNIDEIFEMAEQIEVNGAKFYRRSAEIVKTPESRELLLCLAVMEDDHRKTFADMRADILSQGQIATVDFAIDPDGQAALYLRAIADGRVFDVKADPAELMTGRETIADIYKIALGMEKDSIIFYLGITELVPEKLGKGKIDGIIREEMLHIQILSEGKYVHSRKG